MRTPGTLELHYLRATDDIVTIMLYCNNRTTTHSFVKKACEKYRDPYWAIVQEVRAWLEPLGFSPYTARVIANEVRDMLRSDGGYCVWISNGRERVERFGKDEYEVE